MHCFLQHIPQGSRVTQQRGGGSNFPLQEYAALARFSQASRMCCNVRGCRWGWALGGAGGDCGQKSGAILFQPQLCTAVVRLPPYLSALSFPAPKQLCQRSAALALTTRQAAQGGSIQRAAKYTLCVGLQLADALAGGCVFAVA